LIKGTDMKLNLIKIFALAAALAVNSAAQTGGQNTDPDVAPTTKPKPKGSTADSKKTDPNAKNSKKTDAAPKSGATTGATGSIRVVPQTTPASTSTKSTAVKPGTPATASKAPAPPASNKSAAPVTGSSPIAVKKTTGTSAAQGSKTAASGTSTTHPANGQSKQPVPVLAVKPAPKQAPVQKSTAASPTRKSAGTGSPFAHKTSQPTIVPKKPATAATVAAAKTSSKVSAAGRRDPFVSPIRNMTVATPTGPTSCATGKRCLAVAELTVQGTAKDTDGRMMAIIARGTNHPAYFLRENDQIFNGNVVKITCDSVIFREYATDAAGRQNAHEVVKNVFPSSEAHKCRSSQ
jgi:hypothetical protein